MRSRTQAWCVQVTEGDASSAHDKVAKLESEVSDAAGRDGGQARVRTSLRVGDAAGAPHGRVRVEPDRPGPAALRWPTEDAADLAERTLAELGDAAKSERSRESSLSARLEAMKARKFPLAVTYFTKLQHSYPKSAISEPAEYSQPTRSTKTGEYDKAILQFSKRSRGMRFPRKVREREPCFARRRLF